jgi:hypothetical protein
VPTINPTSHLTSRSDIAATIAGQCRSNAVRSYYRTNSLKNLAHARLAASATLAGSQGWLQRKQDHRAKFDAQHNDAKPQSDLVAHVGECASAMIIFGLIHTASPTVRPAPCTRRN